MDTSEAEKMPGVVKVITCFDVPDFPFPTAGHPWSTDPKHWDPMDRRLLNRRVRLYGDDIAAVIAEDEIGAARALRAIKVEYEEYPVLLSPEEAMKEGAPLLHEECPRNILKATSLEDGDFEEAIREPGLIRVDGVYETPIVQHCHIETAVSFAYMENGRIVVVASTQIPHIVRRIVGQALGIPWGKVRIIKPYIGGGFGNKQDSLYYSAFRDAGERAPAARLKSMDFTPESPAHDPPGPPIDPPESPADLPGGPVAPP
jgi:xanthine dehydrogenase molybdenum-binding subunit